jgi:hypothetical protein
MKMEPNLTEIRRKPALTLDRFSPKSQHSQTNQRNCTVVPPGSPKLSKDSLRIGKIATKNLEFIPHLDDIKVV